MKGGGPEEEGRRHETTEGEMGVQWELENEGRMWEDKEGRPVSRRAVWPGFCYMIPHRLCLRCCQHLPQLASIRDTLVGWGDGNEKVGRQIRWKNRGRRTRKEPLFVHYREKEPLGSVGGKQKQNKALFFQFMRFYDMNGKTKGRLGRTSR